ncbi:MAG TPA: hypothetical protein VL361_17385 [Candidatus Limnocylindrales bacterium]|nr:hypothetical protein [Candidatus Limnocylindrales bacterium]
MDPVIINLSANQLRRAAELKQQIEALEDELNQLLGAPVRPLGNGTPRKRHLSAAAIARIRAAQKARWAKVRRTSPNKKSRRRMTAAGRARLAEIARARWKAAKAQGKSAL